MQMYHLTKRNILSYNEIAKKAILSDFMGDKDMFPKNFLWGVSTAAYQVEGAVYEDGRKSSIWDDFCKVAGAIKDGSSGEVSVDHYHKFKEDVALLKELGIKAYRFSISWSRVMPDGTGKVNEKGILFYRNLLSELKNAGIVPFITLYHWDLPTALHEKGGWENPDSPKWFAEYAAKVVDALKDLADNFITFNEPSVFLKGYINGVHAPGMKLPMKRIVPLWHNLIMAHSLAVKEIRMIAPNAKIGVAPCSIPYVPENEESVEPCRKAYFAIGEKALGNANIPIKKFYDVPSAFLDPVVFGKYPDELISEVGEFLPKNFEKELEESFSPIDFIGENIYQGRKAKLVNGRLTLSPLKMGYPRTAIDWPVVPECIYWMLRFIYDRYQLPIIISENGMSCHDWVSLDGKVHDPNRVDYLARHLAQGQRAIDENIPLFGYFHWSFIDNFEWARGYFDRFGLVYVDYESLKRIPKDSAYFYRDIILSNGEILK